MEKKIYKCFVASPGDTEAERESCIKIFEELNKGIGDKFGFVIEERMWEHNTRPSIGKYSQAVVSEQLGDDYDVFIGIMNNKFGTETKSAGSGTEEEFNNAYERIKRNEKVEIMFYFNDEPVKKSEIIPDELIKVKAFKKKIGDLGAYHWTYNGADDFERTFRTQLTSYFLSLSESKKTSSTKTNVQFEILRAKFQDQLNKALRAFNSQPIIWVDPILSNTNEISQNADENYTKRIDISELINNPESSMIKAPPQFGLTCLAHYLVLKAWENEKLFLRLDSDKTKSHNIHNAVINEVDSIGFKISDIKAIILDSWKSYELDSLKKLKNLSDSYKDIPLIVMNTIEDGKFLKEPHDIKINRNFKALFLLALPRTQIRKVVSEYNKVKEIGIEDKVLTKVVNDLEVLNIHRTPMNCLTLLKVSEKYFDESPINRTDMIEKVLFVLFNMDGIPRYRTRPDLKDCEFVLGRYCERLIRTEKYSFTRDEFLREIKNYCEEKLIDLEVDVVFDVLFLNHIIVKQENDFGFRSSFWIYYFAARQMHNDENFAQYIFSTKKYSSFPEIIEFYTGIDRNKIDALKVLTKDIKETCDVVNSKVRLTGNMNIFEEIQWKPTEEQIQSAQYQLSENVINSGLPEDIKDQHADRNYNQIKPYNQSIQAFFTEYSLHNLMQNIRASSRALRNSDYVKPEAKREMLSEILRSWEQISNVLLALTPILADKGRAGYDGHSFALQGDFGDSFEKRLNRIIQVNMTNVVGFFKDDIYSSKIAPLLYEHFKSETNLNKKHQLALLLIFCRPREWRKQIQEYIISLQKNSFYLYDTHNALMAKYNFDFISEEERREITLLAKMCFAKHEFGSKNPTPKEMARINIPKPKTNDGGETVK
jgi:hypothetical protein